MVDCKVKEYMNTILFTLIKYVGCCEIAKTKSQMLETWPAGTSLSDEVEGRVS